MGQAISGPATIDSTKKKRRGFDSAADYAHLLASFTGKAGERGNKNRRVQQQGCVLLSFLSPSCGLCKSLRQTLDDLERRKTIQVVRIDSSNVDTWGPELLRYNIETIPCFVLLDQSGNAIGKTVAFSTKQVVERALVTLLGDTVE